MITSFKDQLLDFIEVKIFPYYLFIGKLFNADLEKMLCSELMVLEVDLNVFQPCPYLSNEDNIYNAAM